MAEDPRDQDPTRAEDPDAPPSEEERAAASALRDALDQGEAVPVVEALRSAHAPRPIDDNEHAAIVARIVKAPARGGFAPRATAPRSAKILRLSVGGVGVALAVAAAVLLVLDSAHGPGHELARARSTQPLFTEPFKAGQASARIDRIAIARAADFRDNRFSSWGVR